MGTVKSESVRGEYTAGTGFEAGNVAPSTKYVDENGKITDDEPTGVGRVLVAQGDTVRPHMVEAMKAGTVDLTPRVDNEHSPGDTSRRESLDVDDDDAPAAKASRKRGGSSS